MNKKKRALSLLLVATMMFNMLPIMTFADERPSDEKGGIELVYLTETGGLGTGGRLKEATEQEIEGINTRLQNGTDKHIWVGMKIKGLQKMTTTYDYSALLGATIGLVYNTDYLYGIVQPTRANEKLEYRRLTTDASWVPGYQTGFEAELEAQVMPLIPGTSVTAWMPKPESVDPTHNITGSSINDTPPDYNLGEGEGPQDILGAKTNKFFQMIYGVDSPVAAEYPFDYDEAILAVVRFKVKEIPAAGATLFKMAKDMTNLDTILESETPDGSKDFGGAWNGSKTDLVNDYSANFNEPQMLVNPFPRKAQALASGKVGVEYVGTDEFTASSISDGALPTGITLQAKGDKYILKGTPTTAGTFNFEIDGNLYSLLIEKLTFTATIANVADVEYGTTVTAPVVTLIGDAVGTEPTNYEVKWGVKGAEDSTYVAFPTVNTTPVGTYTAKVFLTTAGLAKFNPIATPITDDFAITKKAPNFTMTNTTVDYTGVEAIVTPAASTDVTGNDAKISYQYKVSTADDNTYTATTPINAGTYTVKAALAAFGNFAEKTITSTLTINKVALTIDTIIEVPNTDDQNEKVEVTSSTAYTVSGLVNEEAKPAIKFTATYQATLEDCSIHTGTHDAGKHPVKITAIGFVAPNTNYTIASAEIAANQPIGTIQNDKITGIVSISGPTKLTYQHGDKIDLNGLSVKITWEKAGEVTHTFTSGAWDKALPAGVTVKVDATELAHDITVLKRNAFDAKHIMVSNGIASVDVGTLVVTKKQLTWGKGTLAIDAKTYNGKTEAVAATGTVPAITAEDIVTGDTIIVTQVEGGAKGTFDTKDAGTTKTVTFKPLAFEIDATAQENYLLPTTDLVLTNQTIAKAVAPVFALQDLSKSKINKNKDLDWEKLLKVVSGAVNGEDINTIMTDYTVKAADTAGVVNFKEIVNNIIGDTKTYDEVKGNKGDYSFDVEFTGSEAKNYLLPTTKLGDSTTVPAKDQPGILYVKNVVISDDDDTSSTPPPVIPPVIPPVVPPVDPEKPVVPGARPAGESQMDKELKTPYIGGYDDQTFKPNGNTTRAEVASMFAQILKTKMEDGKAYDVPFQDVSTGKWYANQIAFLSQYKILEGYEDGSFHPEQTITRAEVAKIIAIAEGLAIEDFAAYSDVPETHWATGYIAAVTKAGIFQGTGAGFNPNQAITRAELVVAINRMLGIDDKVVVDEISVRPNDITGHWAEADILKAANKRTTK